MVFSNANTKRTIISISAAQTASKTQTVRTTEKLSKSTSILKSLTLLLMGMAFFVGGVKGQTISLNTTSSTIGVAGTYNTVEASTTTGGYTYKVNNWIGNTSNIQVRGNQSTAASNFYIYNSTVIPGNITAVSITGTNIINSKINLIVGTSAITSSSGGTAGGASSSTGTSASWTVTGSNTYFRIQFLNGSTSGTATLTNITLTYSASSSTVTFDPSGGSITTSTQTASSSTALTSASTLGLSKSGYTFGGWASSAANATAGIVAYADAASYAFSSSTTLYAIWNSTVTFNPSSGSISTTTQTANVATNLTSASTLGLTRTGYTFGGWATSAANATAGTVAYANSASYPFTGGAATLYAIWNINSYAVTFNSNGGSSVTIQNINYNSTATQPTDPTKTGYTFAGWYSDAGLTTSYSFATSVTAAITLYAKWTINSYAVTFNSNGGSSVTTQNINYNSTATQPTTPTLTGYTFAGWYSDAGLTSSYSFATPITAAITLYANWTINNYTVSFNNNGGTGTISNQSINYNASANLTTNTFTRTGYSFAGWNTVANGSGSSYTDGQSYTMGAANVTLYAQWTVNSYNLSYDGNGSDGGTAVSSSSNNYNSSVTLPSCTFTYTGYTFSTWNTQADGLGTDYAAGASYSMPASATTLYAKWISAAVPVCPSSTAVTPASVQTICVGTSANQLTAAITNTGAAGTPTLLYQWYYNTTNSNTISGATIVSGATNSTYTPLTTVAEVGTRYYFCVGYASDNSCGQSNTTQALASNAVQVTVNARPTAATLSGTNTICSGSSTNLSVAITAGSSSSFTVVYSGGTVNSYTSGANISVSPSTNTTYTLTSITDANGCTVASPSGSASITVNARPTAATLSGAATICSGNSTTLSVAITAGASSSFTVVYSGGTVNSYTSGANISVSPSSNTTYTLTSVTDANGCTVASPTGSAAVTVNARPTAATLSGAATICSGSSTNLSVAITAGASSTFTVVYSGGTVNSYTSGANISVSPSSNTTYTLTSVTDANGCTVASPGGSAVITVNARPTAATLSGTNTICSGSSTNLSVAITAGASSVFTVVYSGGTVNSYTSGANISVSPTSNTTYTLTSVTDANGCTVASPSGSATITVNSLTAPTATAATNVASSSFTANWGTVGCATSYALDVYTGTSSTLSEGFESGLSTSGYITGGGSLTLSSGTWTFESAGLRNSTNVHSNTYSCQIKSGASFYAATTLNDCGVVTFWWFSSTAPTVKYGTTTYATTQIGNTGSWYQFSCAINSISSNTLYFYNSSGATGYLDDVSMTASRTNIITGQSVVGTTYNVSGLSGSTTYNYVVRSVNGTSSGNSNVISVTTTTPSYYSKSTGNLDVLGTWGTNTDGSGTAPTDFTTAGVVYNIVNNLTPTIGAAWTVSGSGAKVVVGDGSTAINFTIPSSFAYSGTIDVTANSILTLQNTTIPSIGTLSATSTVVYDGGAGTTQTISASTYGNLTVQNSGAVKTLAGAVTLLGNTFTLASGTTLTSGTNVISFNAAGGTATINGIFQTANSNGFSGTSSTSISSTNTPTVTLGATSTVEYNATTTSQAITTRADYYNLTLTGGSSGSFLKAMGTTPTIVAGGTFTVNSTAIANFITTQMFFGGAGCTVNVNGTLQTQKATGGLTGASTSVFQSTNAPTVNLGSSSTIVYNATGGQVVSANTYANLTIGGTRASTPTITLASGTITVTGTVSNAISGAVVWSNSGNTFDYASASAQTIAAFFYNNLTNSGNGARTLVGTTGTIDIAGTYTPTTGAVTVSTSTVNFSGADGQIIPASSYYNLSSSNNARTLASTSSINIAGTFTIGSGLYTIGTSTVNFNGTSSQTIPIPAVSSGSNYYNLTYSGTSTAIVSGNTSIAGDLSLSGGTFSWTNTGSSSYIVTVNGNLTMTNGCRLDLNFNTTTGINKIFLKGNLSISGSSTWIGSSTNPTGTIVFNGTSQTYSNTATSNNDVWTSFTVGDGTNPTLLTLNTNLKLNGSNSSVPATLTIANNGTLDMGTYNFIASNTVYNSTTSYSAFIINSGGTLKTSNTGGISGTGSSSSNGSITTTRMATTFSAGANYILNGATTSPFPTSSFGSPANLTVNAAVSLNTPITVSGTLTLAAILTTTATNSLTLTNTANTAISGGSTSAFINGPLTWTMGSASTGTYTIPLGVTSVYYPISFVAGSNTGSPTITAQAFTAATGSVDATLSSVSSTEYWNVVTTSGFNASSFSIAKSNLADLTTFNTIGSNTSNSSYTDIGGSAGTVSGQNGVVSSVNGLSGAGTKYFALAVIAIGPSTSVSGTLSALTTTYGLPSTTTTFNVSGQNLTTGITITPPAGFEVSTTSDFSSNIGNNSSPLVVGSAGTLASTPIYVRLLATASVGAYSGNITCATSGTLTKNMATVSSSVSAKALSIAGLTIPSSKTYDGTLTASVTGTPALSTSVAAGTGTSIDGKPITGDNVSLSVGSVTGTYNSANVSSATTITIGGITLAGTAASNYTLTTTVNATITTAALSLTASAQSKNYGVSSSTSGTLNTNYTISGLVGSDAVNVALAYSGSPAGNLATANAGTYTITPSITSFSVGTSSNYGTASITTGTLTINGSVPSAPTITTIVPGNNQLTINFTAGSTGGSAITNYKYSTDGGLSFKSAGTTTSPLVITVASGSSATLVNGTSYSIQIEAVNALGDGTATSTIVAIPVNASVPGAPSIVSATATGNSGEVAVAYIAPASNGNATITTYTATSTPGGITGILSQAGSGTIIVSGLTNGTSYTFTITATNVVGTGSASTASASVIPSLATPKISITTAGNYTFTVPNGVTSIVVEAYGAGGGGGGTNQSYSTPGGGAGGSYVKHSLSVTPGQTYKYTVGDGGAGGTGGGNGVQGNSSYFGNSTAGSSTGAVILAVGGNGGVGNTTNAGTSSNYYGGIIGGVGTNVGNLPVSGSLVNVAGGNGGTSTGGASASKSSGVGGVSYGSGSISTTGTGGVAITSTASGDNGAAPGGGGSGGVNGSSANDRPGGKGGAGAVTISYSTPITTDILTPGTTTYNFPSGVTQALIECWGSGGAGGSAIGSTLYRATGGGGAAGAYANKLLTVNSSTSYAVSVGASVSSSTSNNAIVSGIATYFKDASTIYAEGGAGGKSVVVSNAVLLGAGGVASSSSSIGDVVYKGGNGSTSTDASSSGSSSGGGGSGAITGIGNNATLNSGGSAGNGGAALIDANNISISGSGGTGGSSGANGGVGTTPGGGGGGAWAAASTTVRTGGASGAGQVNVNYYLVPTITGTSPTYVAAGSGSFTLTVTGTNFFSGVSTITWGGVALSTTYVNSYTLTANVASDNVTTAGSVAIGISNTGAYGTSISVSNQTFTIRPVYSISFDNNGGTGSISSQQITSGESATLTSNTFTKTGYAFAGWNTANDGSGTSYADGATYTMGGANVTLYAVWNCNSGTWTGATSTAWNNAANWCGGTIPSSGDNVVILNVSNKPVISSNTTVGDIYLASGATLSIGSNTLTINGAISGSGTLTGSATSALVIAGTAGTINFTSGNNTIKDLTLNSSATATLGGTTNITAGATPGTVTIASGATLTTGGNLVIKSDALGTARIAQSAGTISGNVTVERYITEKAGRRFSFVGTSVTQSVRNAWQQQIYVTGPGTGGLPCGSTTGNGGNTDKYNSNGFDATITGANTILKYNAAVANSSHYAGIANTGVSLTPGTGYSVNIRGNRNSATVTCDNQLNGNSPTAPEAVTLSATGTVTTGDLAVTLNDKAVHNFTLLANPYPSQISFLAFKGDNSIINNKMWTFSPFGSGNFTTLSNGHIVNGATGYDDTYGNIIASGQAFFVEANANGSVTFSESHKTSGNLPNTQYFGIVPEKTMRIGFYNTANTRLDEILLIYNKQGTKEYDANLDATSMSLTSQALVAYKGSNKLAIAYLPDSTVADTTQLGVAIKAGSYTLKFSQLETIDSLQAITLIDKFLGTTTDIRSNPTYNFNVTTDTASKGANRFKVVLSGAVPLAVNFTGINATQNANGVAVKWSVANEAKIASYSVERSTDGVRFTSVNNSKAIGTSTYTVQDANLPASANTLYYRVKATDNLGKATYTNIATVKLSIANYQLSIFPNPVQRKLNLTLAGTTSGSLYNVKITTATGKLAFAKSDVPVAGNAITFDASSFAAGVYLIELTDAKGNKLVSKFVKE